MSVRHRHSRSDANRPATTGSPAPPTLHPGAAMGEEVTEYTPLVGGEGLNRPIRSRGSSFIHNVSVPKVHNPKVIQILINLLVLLASGGVGLWVIPATRKMEDIICQQHYELIQRGDNGIDESLCKGDAIQSRLAFIFAVYSALESAIGMSLYSARPGIYFY
jgi:hypothetical protein